jgi:acetyl-CoA carboxylase carboxyltransferase component
LYSGVIPQLSVIVGPTAGGAVYSPAITDFVFMVKGLGQSYITGPDVVETVTGEKVSLEALGGATVNASKSGNCHFLYENEEDCFQEVRRLLSFLPQNHLEKAVSIECKDDISRQGEDILDIIPDNSAQAYDMKQIILKVVDDGDFMEVHQRFACNFIVGFARLGGSTIGILAQQPSYMAGVLDIDASDKAARFVRTCDCFNIPLVTLIDVPGYMPGTDQEFRGIIRHGAKLLFAYAEATVPKVSVIIRKAYGGAYIAMSSKSLRGDINYAWPTAEIAVMGPDAAVNFVYRRELKEANNSVEAKQRLSLEYRKKFANPYIAAARGYIDDVIDPRDTRPKLIRALQMLNSKEITNLPKKHGNIPL